MAVCRATLVFFRQGHLKGEPMTMEQLMTATNGKVTWVNGGLYAVDYESYFYLPPVCDCG